MHQSYTLTRVTRKVTHKSYPRTELPAKLHIRVIREQSYPQSYTHELPPNTSYTKVIQKLYKSYPQTMIFVQSYGLSYPTSYKYELPANRVTRKVTNKSYPQTELPAKLQIRVTRKQSYPHSYK